MIWHFRADVSACVCLWSILCITFTIVWFCCSSRIFNRANEENVAKLHSILITALFLAYYLGMMVGMIGMSGNFALLGGGFLGTGPPLYNWLWNCPVALILSIRSLTALDLHPSARAIAASDSPLWHLSMISSDFSGVKWAADFDCLASRLTAFRFGPGFEWIGGEVRPRRRRLVVEKPKFCDIIFIGPVENPRAAAKSHNRECYAEYWS
jgi:hypothetical protein